MAVALKYVIAIIIVIWISFDTSSLSACRTLVQPAPQFLVWKLIHSTIISNDSVYQTQKTSPGLTDRGFYFFLKGNQFIAAFDAADGHGDDKVEEGKEEEDANSPQVTGKAAIHDLVAFDHIVDREEFGKMEDRFR